MAGDNSFWDDSFEIQEAEADAIGPALSDGQIAAWERQRGLRLPEILRQAFLQQDGGHVRNQPIYVEPLNSLAPVEDGHLDYAELAESDLEDVETGLDFGKMVHFGRDAERGCSLLLYYGENGAQGEPPVYGYWGDGDRIDRLADRLDDLVHGVRH